MTEIKRANFYGGRFLKQGEFDKSSNDRRRD
jgi:hypothetical protein